MEKNTAGKRGGPKRAVSVEFKKKMKKWNKNNSHFNNMLKNIFHKL
jgi:uncharacterized protein YukE